VRLARAASTLLVTRRVQTRERTRRENRHFVCSREKTLTDVNALHVAAEQRRAVRKANDNAGFTLVELLMVVGIIAIISALATPNLLRARLVANEASAISSMRAINSAESAYAAVCAFGGYAVTIDDLAKAPAGSTNPFISADLSANNIEKSGYFVNVGAGVSTAVITPSANTCNAAANNAVGSYFAEAHPASIGVSGQRSFGTDHRGGIFQDPAGNAFTAATVMAATLVVQ
jgi:prepilin-type N-terminal cleavage/methylation domain-containing protein